MLLVVASLLLLAGLVFWSRRRARTVLLVAAATSTVVAFGAALILPAGVLDRTVTADLQPLPGRTDRPLYYRHNGSSIDYSTAIRGTTIPGFAEPLLETVSEVVQAGAVPHVEVREMSYNPAVLAFVPFSLKDVRDEVTFYLPDAADIANADATGTTPG